MLWSILVFACHTPPPKSAGPLESAPAAALRWRWLRATPAADSSCGITLDGILVCWGEREPGRGAYPQGFWKPFGEESVDASVVSTGQNHGCILDKQGQPRCWQNSTNGPDLTDAIAQPVGPLRDIATPLGETCGLNADGEIRCWGGWGSAMWDLTGHYLSITSGLDDLCAVTEDHNVACWQTFRELEPIPSVPDTTEVNSEMSVACALDSAHQAHCFGDDWAALGAEITTPLRSLDVSPKIVCGITEDSTIQCWGPTAATTLAPPPGAWASVSCSLFHCCALAADGSATCWGLDDYGAIDIPTADDLN